MCVCVCVCVCGREILCVRDSCMCFSESEVEISDWEMVV